MIYLEEKKFLSVTGILVAGLILATFFLYKRPEVLAIMLAACLVITIVLGVVFIRRIYKKLIQTEQYLDDIISNENELVFNSRVEKDGVFASIFEEIKELEKIQKSREAEKNRELLWQKNLMNDISHQIKTPLASLEIYTDIFRKSIGEDEEKQELSKHAIEAIERIRWLVTGMLQIAKLESGAYQMDKKELPINETIDRVLYMLEPIIKEKNITIHKEEQKQNGNDIIVTGDSKWLEEAFVNILKNAMEYSERDGIVDICISDTPLAISVEIKDYGEGIPEDEVPKIFNRFYKASGQKEKKDSVGIGLNLSKEIIKAHGGTITAESKTGVNSYTSIYTTFLKDS